MPLECLVRLLVGLSVGLELLLQIFHKHGGSRLLYFPSLKSRLSNLTQLMVTFLKDDKAALNCAAVHGRVVLGIVRD